MKPEGAEIFKEDPPGSDRPAAWPIWCDGVAIKVRGDGAAMRGKFLDRTDEYGSAPSDAT